MNRSFYLSVALAASLAWTVISAAEPKSNPPPKAPPSPVGTFGIRRDGISSPETRQALDRMQQAGVVPGRRGSLSFFRWTDATPPQLAHLGLWGAAIDNELLALAALLPDLEHVSLYETNVDDKGLSVLARLPKLRTFSVLPISRYEKAGFGPTQWSYPFMPQRPDRPRITGASLQALAHAKTLERLDLLDARIVSADLEGLSVWPKLSSLSLPGPIDDVAVKHLQSCRRLTSLTLGEREISPAELQSLAAWKGLRSLTISHAQLSDETLQAFSNLESLEELHLADCGLKDDQLRHLRFSPKLSQLGLERNEIDGPGLEHLVRWNLKSLGLEFNNLGDTTLTHLTQLVSLERLALSYCHGVTDQGIRSGTLQKMTHLKELGLRGLKQITDGSLDNLAALGHLAHINVRQTKISDQGIEQMKKSMPQTTVFK